MSAWIPVKDGDFRVLGHYRRHYSSAKSRRVRKAYENPLVLGPGEKSILLTIGSDAVFAWRNEQFRQDGEAGVECAIFHNDSAQQSSDLIREASFFAWDKWPGERLFTFVDPSRVRSTNPGYCFLQAGWRRLKRRTERGLRILEILPS